MLVILALIACHEPASEGCLEPDLSLWCWPEADDAADCGIPKGEPSYRCDGYDVIASGSEGGVAHFFDHATGEHVATEYWRDVRSEDEWCGGLTYWFGRRIECTVVCTYDGSNADVPVCE